MKVSGTQGLSTANQVLSDAQRTQVQTSGSSAAQALTLIPAPTA